MIPEKYLCPKCGAPADFRMIGDYGTAYKDTNGVMIQKTLGVRFQCENGHPWEVPGFTALDAIMDPGAEPLYKKLRERSGAPK